MAQESRSPLCLYRLGASGLHLGPLGRGSLIARMLFFSEPPPPAHHASSSCSSLWKHFFFCRSTLPRRFRRKKNLFHFKQDILDGSAGKESACHTEDIGGTSLVPGSGRPGKGSGYPLQYSCLENPMDRGAWWPTAQSIGKSQTRLST